MSRSHVRGILGATTGARRSSTVLMGSKSTGKLASGFVARLAVTRKVKQENGKLKSTRESMQLMSKNLEDCPSSCSRPSDPTLPSSCAVHIYLQNSQQKEGGCVQFCGGTLSIP